MRRRRRRRNGKAVLCHNRVKESTRAATKSLDVILAQGGVAPRLQARHGSLRLLGAQQLAVGE
jgi:hypothetical protein